MRQQVEELHASTRASKERVAVQKRQAGIRGRERMAAERESKRQIDEARAAAKPKYHDDIYEWKMVSAIDV